jgi:glyoxylase-like metal-dependent hydrolase (beta-lactamase superfamily II)
VNLVLEIKVVQVGVLATNCYILSEGSECVVVDPGGEVGKIISALDELPSEPHTIISTHAHADHTGAVAPLIERFGSDFAIGNRDEVSVNEQMSWLKSMLGDFVDPPSPTKILNDGDKISIGDTEIMVIATPGHTPGSISLRVDGHVLTGDTLFRETIGRFDLSGGDEAQEIASIKEKLLTLPPDTVVLPGHGQSSSVAHELEHNQFIR